MSNKGMYFILGAFTVIALRTICDNAIKQEDQRKKKAKAQKVYDEEDLEMLDEDIYAEEW